MPTVKPGLKTTELWAVILNAVGQVAAAAAGKLPAPWAAATVAVSVVAYALARGIAKRPPAVIVAPQAPMVVTAAPQQPPTA